MKNELCDYDVFPKVFPEERPVTVTIRPLGDHVAFKPGAEYAIRVFPCGEGFTRIPQYQWRREEPVRGLVAEDDGSIRFTHLFHGEQPHKIRVYEAAQVDVPDWRSYPNFVAEVTVYSLLEDLCGFYPFRGDLHMHSNRSDGKQAPAIVAAAYREWGLDFTVLSDHQRYYPSLDCIRAYKDVPIEFTIVPGEEVHLPDNDIHIVNFGSTYSVNGLLRELQQVQERGEAVSERAIIDDPPPVIDAEEFKRQVDELIPTLDIPEGIEAFQYAACVWECEQIRKGGGISIFAHPFWYSGGTWQVPEDFTRFLLRRHPFDAFEVLGGTDDPQQNRLQVALYHDIRAEGIDFPIVGSTDSHSCYNNPAGNVSSTLVLARENTRESLVEAVRAGRTAAIDTLGTPIQIIGSFRLVKYADFLFDYFFPLHDVLCREEGALMKGYVTGDSRAEKTIRCISGRMKEQREKYFRF